MTLCDRHVTLRVKALMAEAVLSICRSYCFDAHFTVLRYHVFNVTAENLDVVQFILAIELLF